LHAYPILTILLVLSFIATIPELQGHGIGTMLTKWGLDRAKVDGTLVYLDSTLSASSMYRKLGFVALDGISMSLPGKDKNGCPCIYEELGMLRAWDDLGIDHWDSSMEILSLKLDYEAGIKPQYVVQAIYDRIEAYKEVQPSVWIHIQPIGDVMRVANDLLIRWPDEAKRPPLWGIPVYERCIEAGALFIGKTNMEQLATGMTGCRSPYGTLHSTFSKSHIVGGSSSGSAVTVSEGLVSFSLGSDTAGSIRVPALYNGVVGFKPTKGTVSAWRVAPASLHQDCVSFLALTAKDADQIWQVCRGYDKRDLFAKFPHPLPYPNGRQISTEHSFRFGTPPESALAICSAPYRQMFGQVMQNLQRAGGKLVSMEWEPFAAANELLYNGAFVLERLTIFPDGWFEKNKQLLHPVTREVFEGVAARKSTAVDLFRDLHKQAEYKRAVEGILDAYGEHGNELAVMVVPTAPFHPTIEEVASDPVGINGRLGTFAHFANVLDLVGIALPCGTYDISEDGRQSLPFGVTILACAGRDTELIELAKVLEDALTDRLEE
jgi:Asp-tRNA(Asn)/Glu-tRNA(Gln) amidotransferase A subunit family amidase